MLRAVLAVLAVLVVVAVIVVYHVVQRQDLTVDRRMARTGAAVIGG